MTTEKTYGQIAWEAGWTCPEDATEAWEELPNTTKADWERDALAVVEEYKRRNEK